MARGLTVRVVLEDSELVEKTREEYVEAIKRGEMDSEEARDNLTALVLGMMKIVSE